MDNTGRRIWRISSWVAAQFPGAGPAASLLFGTAAQESGFVHRRQIGFEHNDELVGGWGLWQLEAGSVSDSIRLIASSQHINSRAIAVLHPLGLNVPRCAGCACRSFTEPENDVVCALFARLHYLQRPGQIPADVNGQARYWKEQYNTYLGSGRIEQYKQNWERLCVPVLNGISR